MTRRGLLALLVALPAAPLLAERMARVAELAELRIRYERMPATDWFREAHGTATDYVALAV